MSGEIEVHTESGKVYFIYEEGGTYYVQKTGWMGREDIGTASSAAEAGLLITIHSGEEISSMN